MSFQRYMQDIISVEVSMRIAVLSGKGGTGKTFVSVNLAYVKGKSLYIDCDVEEPNGRLFLKPHIQKMEAVNSMIPSVDKEKCSGCRKCVEFCKFNALAYIKDKLLVFPELCHACNGCVMLCPEGALTEGSKHVGYIEHGMSQDVRVMTGILNTGEASGVPIIRQLLSTLSTEDNVIIDCPPGSACTVMESIKEADYCLLVAEPTKFGIHNLNMVYNLVKLFNKPHALIINKDMGDKDLIEKYCVDKNIRVIASIPYDAQLGLAISKGFIAAEKYTEYMELFKMILNTVEKEVHNETACDIKR